MLGQEGHVESSKKRKRSKSAQPEKTEEVSIPPWLMTSPKPKAKPKANAESKKAAPKKKPAATAALKRPAAASTTKRPSAKEDAKEEEEEEKEEPPDAAEEAEEEEANEGEEEEKEKDAEEEPAAAGEAGAEEEEQGDYVVEDDPGPIESVGHAWPLHDGMGTLIRYSRRRVEYLSIIQARSPGAPWRQICQFSDKQFEDDRKEGRTAREQADHATKACLVHVASK